MLYSITGNPRVTSRSKLLSTDMPVSNEGKYTYYSLFF